MIAGCYSLHLYCDVVDCTTPSANMTSIETTGRTQGEATREARQRGWTVNHAAGTARCEKHRRSRFRMESSK